MVQPTLYHRQIQDLEIDPVPFHMTSKLLNLEDKTILVFTSLVIEIFLFLVLQIELLCLDVQGVYIEEVAL